MMDSSSSCACVLSVNGKKVSTLYRELTRSHSLGGLNFLAVPAECVHGSSSVRARAFSFTLRMCVASFAPLAMVT